MKMGLILGLALAVVCVGAAGAGQHPEKGMCPMMKKGDKGYCCAMHAKVCKEMMDREVVATSDGGVVVLTGGMLTKYDKDLNKVKETEITFDVEAIRAKMREMCAACPMNKKAMKQAERAARCEKKMQEKQDRAARKTAEDAPAPAEQAEQPPAQPAEAMQPAAQQPQAVPAR